MEFFYYRAYGLYIKSEIELEELSISSPFDELTCDVTIKIGKIDGDDHSDLMRLHPQVRVGPGKLWLDITDISAYNVSNGCEIIVQPHTDADPGAIALFLLGSCMGALLWQRGFTVLHGNAIRIEDAVAVCVGHSGAGKSTLAAEFARRGHEIISDDVVAIDDDVMTKPGIGRIKLWQKSLDYFQIENRNLARIRKGEDKFSLKFAPSDPDTALPVRWVFVLEPDDCATPCITPLRGSDGLSALLEHSYRRELIKGLGLQTTHFKNCAKILSKTTLARLRRPVSGFQVHELCEAIIQHTAVNRLGDE